MVGCLVVASKLLPTVPVPHVDSTMSVTNSVDATRPRASTGNVVYESPSLSPRRGTLFEKIEFSPSYLSLSFSWTIQSKELYLNIKKSSRKTWFETEERIFLQRIQFPRRWKVSNFDERSPIKNYFEGCMEKNHVTFRKKRRNVIQIWRKGGRGSSEKDFDKSFRLRTCFLLDRFPILLDLPLIPRMI